VMSLLFWLCVRLFGVVGAVFCCGWLGSVVVRIDFWFCGGFFGGRKCGVLCCVGCWGDDLFCFVCWIVVFELNVSFFFLVLGFCVWS